MGNCKKCGIINVSDAKFCRNCGASLKDQQSKSLRLSDLKDKANKVVSFIIFVIILGVVTFFIGALLMAFFMGEL